MHAISTPWSVASWLLSLFLLWETVGGGTVRKPIQGCPIATFSLPGEQCHLKLLMEGSLPPWLRVANLTEELLILPSPLLASFAKRQICACEPPEVTASCSPEVVQAVSRLTAACGGLANSTSGTAGEEDTDEDAGEEDTDEDAGDDAGEEDTGEDSGEEDTGEDAGEEDTDEDAGDDAVQANAVQANVGTSSRLHQAEKETEETKGGAD